MTNLVDKSAQDLFCNLLLLNCALEDVQKYRHNVGMKVKRGPKENWLSDIRPHDREAIMKAYRSVKNTISNTSFSPEIIPELEEVD